MTDLLRDAIWQFIGAILGLIAIIVTLVIFFLQRRRKTLTYEVLSLSSLVSVADEVAGNIKILFQEVEAKNVYLLVLKLENTGNISITPNDYERDIYFKFNDNAQILTADISETTPENLNAEISIISGKSLSIKPVLLNSGDSLTIKLLISNFADKIIVDGRLVGIKSIERYVERFIKWSSIVQVVGIIVALTPIFLNLKFPTIGLEYDYLLSAIVFFGLIMAFAGFIMEKFKM